MDPMNVFYGYNRISKELLNYYVANHEDENVVCSPFSLYVLLGVAMSGTGGESREELCNALAGKVDPSELSQMISDISAMCTGDFDGGRLNSANGVFVKEMLASSIKDEFRQVASKLYDAEIFPVDQGFLDKVNSWVSDKTDGMIPTIIEEEPVGLAMALVNAISFDAAWEKPYKEAHVEEGEEFYNCDGTVGTVNMLYSREESLVIDENCIGFVKPYEGGQYSFMALLPNEEGKAGLDKVLSGSDFAKLYDDSRYGRVDAVIPEFEMASDMELKDLCVKLGIKSIFTPEADFSGVVENEPLQVDSVVQKACLKLDRNGTRAAAATAMAMRLGAAINLNEIIEIRLDRPFVYGIMNSGTGLPVFTGVVNKL